MERSTIVVANALAARQWEHHLSAAEIAAGRAAWASPPVTSYGNWLDALSAATGDTAPLPLTPTQSLALWRRVINESRYAAELIGDIGVANWAAQAWELLHRWRIDPASERAGANDFDYQALLRWCRSYREQLDANGWLDRAELEARLDGEPHTALGRIVLADLDEPYPARTALLARLTAAGAQIEVRSAPFRQAATHAVCLPDAATELRMALGWSERRLRSAPDTRIALVVAGLAARRAEVERLLATTRGTGVPVWSAGSALATDPAIGAALVGLSLFAPAAPYATFGRWLRSPFFSATDAERTARALLDAELRSDLRSQPPLRTAYRECGLAQLLEQRAPATGSAIAAGLAAIGSRQRATPGYWAHAWTRALAGIGWQAPLRTAALLGWQAALDEVARLTPILGEVTYAAALQELERVLERPEPTAPPLRGIHVLAHVDDVGPGYGAVWATGFTDAYWPETTRGNPLLPRALQRAHGMPRASPQAARAAAERSVARLLARTPLVVASWPARVYDYETEPSPAIRDWQPLPPDDIPRQIARWGSVPNVRRETVDDVPPPLRTAALAGGAGMIGRQARSPLRAFCQYRLGAREIEMLGFGVSARLRGIVIHRAAQLLYANVRSQSDVLTLTESTIEASIVRALDEEFGAARAPLRTLFELEAERLRSLLAALLQQEAARQPFDVVAIEQASETRLGPWTLRLRVDRLDRLADGRIAILDYKTGEGATSGDWFTPRLRDAQVPLYATLSPEAVGATVIVKVGATAARYLGVWEDSAFPGRAARLPTDSWEGLVAGWRAQLEALAAEFARGDTRVFFALRDDTDGVYAPLTRIHEQVALVRGALPPW
jgi:probable DNA repair protein